MSIRWDELPEYEPPRLPRLRLPGWVFVAGNAGFALGVVLVASSASTAAPAWVRWTATTAWLAMLGVGWWLCDRLTRSVLLLDGRWPSRARVARAWLLPPLWLAFAELVILRLDPTEIVDVRPAIAAFGFGFAAWRPFSAIRRILHSLTRLNHDALVIVFGFLHVAVWSLTWWLLHASPAGGLGVAWAGAIASFGFVAVSIALTAVFAEAVAHRVLALQTREEHRYVRSLGLNPVDAGTFLSLVMAKQERARHRGVMEEVDAPQRDHALRSQPDSQPEPEPEPERKRPEAEPTTTVARHRYRHVRTSRRSVSTPRPSRTAEPPTPEPEPPTPEPEPTPGAEPEPATPTGALARSHQAGSRSMAPVGDPGSSSGDEPSSMLEEDATSDLQNAPPPLLASYEIARFAALFGLIATVAGYAWTTVVALVQEDVLGDGLLSPNAIAGLDRSRSWTNAILVAALPLQTWWVVVARLWVRRGGFTLELRPASRAAIIATLLALALLVLQLIGAPTTVRAVWLVLTALVVTGSIVKFGPTLASWAGTGGLAIRLWGIGTGAAACAHAVTGGTGSITATSSLQVITFVSVIIGGIVAVTAIVGAVFSLEIEDDLRGSSAVAQWYFDRFEADLEDDDAHPAA